MLHTKYTQNQTFHITIIVYHPYDAVLAQYMQWPSLSHVSFIKWVDQADFWHKGYPQLIHIHINISQK